MVRLYKNFDISKNHKGSIILIGNFDGVHLGHQKLFKLAKSYKKKYNLKIGVINFDPMPKMFFNKKLKKLGKDFIQLTGNDDNALEFNKKGGVGAISVTANIAPKLCSDFQRFSKSSNDNEIKEAERLNEILQPVHHAMFVESNPSPVKYAAKLMNLCDDAVRLPLVKTSESVKPVIKKALESAKLIQ